MPPDDPKTIAILLDSNDSKISSLLKFYKRVAKRQVAVTSTIQVLAFPLRLISPCCLCVRFLSLAGSVTIWLSIYGVASGIFGKR